MEALATIGKRGELAPQSSDSKTLTMRSGPPPPEGTGPLLALWMAETQGRDVNQELPPGTPDMYLVEWEEMVMKYGEEVFRIALSRAIRESSFFPAPNVINMHCDAESLDRKNRIAGRAAISAHDAAKAL